MAFQDLLNIPRKTWKKQAVFECFLDNNKKQSILRIDTFLFLLSGLHAAFRKRYHELDGQDYVSYYKSLGML